MYDAVRTGRSLYSDRQREAWVPVPRSGSAWNDRLRAQDVALATIGDSILGFMSLTPGGYIDFAHIRPAAQGSGLFRELFDRIVERARVRGQTRLWVHASLMAEPAFGALGFRVVRRERVPLGGEQFDRCEMEKILQEV
jgi:putative acetyltransferase